MATYLVWIVVSLSSNGVVSYSPPVASLVDCEKLIASNLSSKAKCVQVNILKDN